MGDCEPEPKGDFHDTAWLNAVFPKIKGKGCLLPPPNFCMCACCVREWQRMTHGKQQDARNAFKSLPKVDRDFVRSLVPGEASAPVVERNPVGNYHDTTWLNKTFKKQKGCGQKASPANWRSSALRVWE